MVVNFLVSLTLAITWQLLGVSTESTPLKEKVSMQRAVDCIIVESYSDDVYRNISLLGIAASNNEVEMVLALIEKGCDPAYNGTSSLMFDYYSAGDNYVGGVTPLHIAATVGAEEVVMELIQHPGVDIDAQDELGLTALWDAASWGYSEIVNMLAKAGADINMPAMDGSTPVHAAASYGYSHTIEILAELGADLNAKGGPDQDTPLIVAAYYGYRDVVKYLLGQGVDVNARDALGKTALYWAKWANYRRIVMLLKKYGAEE